MSDERIYGEEPLSYDGTDSYDLLLHYGTPRHSGRYPWGSGDDPYQHSGDFASRVQELKRSGMSEKDIATAVGCKNTSDLRLQYSRAITQQRADRVATAMSLRADGLSNAEAARRMGINESTYRSLLNERSKDRMNAARNTAEQLKKLVDEKGMIDVGIGVERELNISREKMNQALKILEDEGYVWYGGGVPQVTNPGKQTNIKVLCPPGTEHKEIYNFENVHTGLANFAIFVVGVGAIIVALGALQDAWGGLTDFLEGGGNVLGQIGTAIGKFIGGIGGGLILGADLPQVGTDLSNFMTNSQGFIDGAKNVDSSAIDGAKNLVSVIGAIAGSQFQSWLVSLFSGENPVTKFSNDIVTLGQSLTKYAFAVLPMAIVPQTVLDRSVSVATALAGVAGQIPATGGIVGLINGIGDLNTFSTNIKSLGTGLADFATEISAIDDSKFNQTKIDAVISVASGLASLESDLEGQGGLEDAIEGVKSLSKFSEGMQPFGEGLNTFITEVAKIEYSPDDDNKKLYAVIDIGTVRMCGRAFTTAFRSAMKM